LADTKAIESTEHAPRFLSLPQVVELTSLSQASVYRYMNLRDFPRPIPIGVQRVAWLEHEVRSWMNERMTRTRVGTTRGR